LASEIEGAGLRFLKMDTRCDQYVELSSERINAKLGHAMRDLLKKRTTCKTQKNIKREKRLCRKRPVSSCGKK
jgi:hypothetical protein